MSGPFYINPNGTLPISPYGSPAPQLMSFPYFSGQCCCDCPCVNWPEIADGPCCGLLQSYSFRITDYPFVATGNGGPRVVGDITLNYFIDSSKPSCTWVGEGGDWQVYELNLRTRVREWRSFGPARAELGLTFIGQTAQTAVCAWYVDVQPIFGRGSIPTLAKASPVPEKSIFGTYNRDIFDGNLLPYSAEIS